MQSNFQFNNPVLLKLLFEAENPVSDDHDGFAYKINTQVNIGRDEDSSKDAIVEVELAVDAFDKKQDIKYYTIVAKNWAQFHWDEEIDEELIEILLQQNAPALLLSYLRPVIAETTANSPYERFNLPYMNLSQNEVNIEE